MNGNTTSVDKLLNGRLQIEQPLSGYRIAVDTLLLAAAVPARGKQRALDLGCGAGGVMLALAVRCPDIRIDGLELQEEMATLCEANIKRNGFEDRLKVRQGDLASIAWETLPPYDLVMMNPPFHEDGKHTVSSNLSRRTANAETTQTDLKLWISAAARALAPEGTLCLIHKHDRLSELISLLSPLFPSVLIKPIAARTGGATKRVILICEKAGAPRCVTLMPFILHQEGSNDYTDEAQAILRHAQVMRIREG